MAPIEHEASRPPLGLDAGKVSVAVAVVCRDFPAEELAQVAFEVKGPIEVEDNVAGVGRDRALAQGAERDGIAVQDEAFDEAGVVALVGAFESDAAAGAVDRGDWEHLERLRDEAAGAGHSSATGTSAQA